MTDRQQELDALAVNLIRLKRELEVVQARLEQVVNAGVHYPTDDALVARYREDVSSMGPSCVFQSLLKALTS